MSEENNMGPAMAPKDADREVFEAVKYDVINRLHEIHHADHIQHLHQTDKLEHISAYNLVLVAYEEAGSGVNYFGKIHLGEGKYVHARCYHGPDGKTDFYALHATRESAIWTLQDPLVYFGK